MQILMLSASDGEGGAGVAAFRLLQGLRSQGVRARMLVQTKVGDDPAVLGPTTRAAKALHLIRRPLDSLALALYPKRLPFTFSPALVPDTLASNVRHLAPDVLHLHWVCAGFLRVETLRRLGRPLLWTLHDSWPFTGGCHIPLTCVRYRQRCGQCPALGSHRDNDLTRWLWLRKKKAWEGVNLTIVAPSRWLGECARASSLFHHLRVEVIPNGLDLTRFRPFDKETSREILGLPARKRLILFGALAATSDRVKGFHLLVPALKQLSSQASEGETELVVFGASPPADPPDLGFPVHYLGRLHDEATLALTYSAADVFVCSSLQENLPNTLAEAQACATPCVAFHVGGIPDLVQHERTGYLARAFETQDLANGLAWVLEDEERRRGLGRNAREHVQHLSLKTVAQRYGELYTELARGEGRRAIP